jgi:hypothetical protein
MTAIFSPRADETVALCRRVLAEDFHGADGGRSPWDWYRLLRDFPVLPVGRYPPTDPLHVASVAALRQAKQDLAAAWPAGAFERFVLLQAMLVAAPQLPEQRLDASVKRMTFDLFARFARPAAREAGYFDLDGPRFPEMAEVATLARFPAGQYEWRNECLPRAWILTTEPLKVPALIRTMWSLGTDPYARFHVNYWRANPLMVFGSEAERSFWRISRSLARQPENKGLLGVSWFYSKALYRSTPHMRWTRDFFTARGALMAEMEHASDDAGFLTGSAKRRALFEQGKFRPRLTLVIWPRDAMLAWAETRPDLADQGAS